MKRVLVIPDTHAPSHDRKAVAAVQAYASTKWYDEVVILGDLGDFDSVNGHHVGRPGLQEGKRLSEDIAACKAVLEDFVFAARHINPAAGAHFLFGNHEARVAAAQSRWPAFMDLPNLREALDCSELGVQTYPYRKRKSAFNIGKLHFLHGSYCGENAVKKHLDKLSCSFVMGHIHRLLTVTKPSQHGTMLGACVGHLADPDIGESYLDGPEGWQQGFAEAYVMPNGTFFLYPIAVLKGGFVAPDGKFYSSNGWDRLMGPTGLSESTNQALYRGPSPSPSGQARARRPAPAGLSNRRVHKTSAGAKPSLSDEEPRRKRRLRALASLIRNGKRRA